MNKLRFLMPIGLLAVPAVFGAAVMLLWNWLMPSLFNLTMIDFWQALGIVILCRILFGSFGGLHHHRAHRGHGLGMRNIREKWQNMTPEQREAFVNRKREHCNRCGFFGKADFEAFMTNDDHTSKEHE